APAGPARRRTGGPESPRAGCSLLCPRLALRRISAQLAPDDRQGRTPGRPADGPFELLRSRGGRWRAGGGGEENAQGNCRPGGAPRFYARAGGEKVEARHGDGAVTPLPEYGFRSDYTSHNATASRRPSSGSRVGMNSCPT